MIFLYLVIDKKTFFRKGMQHNIVRKMLKVTECSDLFYIFIKLHFSNLNIFFFKLNCYKIQLYKNKN